MPEQQPPGEYFCPQCNYDLRSVSEPRCPECGFRFDWRALRMINAEWYDERLSEFHRAFFVGVTAVAAVVIYRVSPFGPQTQIDYYLRKYFLYLLAIVVWLILTGRMDKWLHGLPAVWVADSERLILGLQMLAATGIGVLVFVLANDLFWVACPGLPTLYGVLTLHEFRRNRDRLELPSMDVASRNRILRWYRAVVAISLLSMVATVAVIAM